MTGLSGLGDLPKAFTVIDPPRAAAMTRAVEDLRRLLQALAAGHLPGTGYDAADLLNFCRSAVDGQRGSLGRTKPGSWSVAATDDGMPADARVDFVFTPTYIVVAILTRVLDAFPEAARAIDGYEAALQRGMGFATLRRLQGHGYEAAEGEAEARRILNLGGVASFLRQHPDFCPALAELLAE